MNIAEKFPTIMGQGEQRQSTIGQEEKRQSTMADDPALQPNQSMEGREPAGLLNYDDEVELIDEATAKQMGAEENPYFKSKPGQDVNLFVGSLRGKNLLQQIMESKGYSKAVVSSGKRTDVEIEAIANKIMEKDQFKNFSGDQRTAIRNVLLRAPNRNDPIKYPRGNWVTQATRDLRDAGISSSEVDSLLEPVVYDSENKKIISGGAVSRERWSYAGYETKHKDEEGKRGGALDLGFNTHFNGDIKAAEELHDVLSQVGIHSILEKDRGALHIEVPTEEQSFLAEMKFMDYQEGSVEERDYITKWLGADKVSKYKESGKLEDIIRKGVQQNRNKHGGMKKAIERINAITAFKNS